MISSSIFANIQKKLVPLLALILFTISGTANAERIFEITECQPLLKAEIYFDHSEDPISFAAEELSGILKSMGVEVQRKTLSDFPQTPEHVYFVIAKDDVSLREMLENAGGASVPEMDEQDYSLRITGTANKVE